MVREFVRITLHHKFKLRNLPQNLMFEKSHALFLQQNLYCFLCDIIPLKFVVLHPHFNTSKLFSHKENYLLRTCRSFLSNLFINIQIYLIKSYNITCSLIWVRNVLLLRKDIRFSVFEKGVLTKVSEPIMEDVMWGFK
jgi:hypothetical protein